MGFICLFVWRIFLSISLVLVLFFYLFWFVVFVWFVVWFFLVVFVLLGFVCFGLSFFFLLKINAWNTKQH